MNQPIYVGQCGVAGGVSKQIDTPSINLLPSDNLGSGASSQTLSHTSLCTPTFHTNLSLPLHILMSYNISQPVKLVWPLLVPMTISTATS